MDAAISGDGVFYCWWDAKLQDGQPFLGDIRTDVVDNTNLFVDAMCVPTCAQNKELAEEYINFMLSDDAAIANAEYICYASPHKNVYTSDVYLEDMGEEAIEVLYPEDFDFAAAYDINCYKDLDKGTKDYINKLWGVYSTSDGAPPTEDEESGCASSVSGTAILCAVSIAAGACVIRKKKKKE